MNPGNWRYVIDFLAIVGGGGLIAKLLTLRQDRDIKSAQAQEHHAKAADSQAAAFQRIIDAAGGSLEHQAVIVPQLLERIAKLETREEQRDLRDDIREAEAAAMRTELDATKDKLESAYQWIDAILGWSREHRSWDEQAMTEIEALGGHIQPPPQIPDRRRPDPGDNSHTPPAGTPADAHA